jgi:hypothetical protein
MKIRNKTLLNCFYFLYGVFGSWMGNNELTGWEPDHVFFSSSSDSNYSGNRDVSSRFQSNYYSNGNYTDSSDFGLDDFNVDGLDGNMRELVLAGYNELEDPIFNGSVASMFQPHPKRWLRKFVKAYNHHKYQKCLKYIRIYENTLLCRGFLPFSLGKISKHQRRIIHQYRRACKKAIKHGCCS